ncbi:MAG TPA: T9SS type A sorting domain-containing protein [Chitinophagales bacterium]|nr:T9SS type A sorting domain-containing protein [Chitinophagales bacterium]HMZ90381.1 T9SS type A sorting domain-containing protein [Chitinophagales bacterium]HNJ89086.1 T9SS type A sorting domain-containing protein [Chitinophagales bacterium]HNK97092.1 T9SS type A sorting domain-containing protein [Chitinophagales bacterium]
MDINAYASIAAYFLGIPNSGVSQVVYVDLNPDITVDEAAFPFGLDMNSDEIIDFEFLHSAFSFYSAPFNSYRYRIDMLVKPLNSQNAISGSYHYHGTFYGGAWWYYPYALLVNDTINESGIWQVGSAQILGLITIDSDDSFIHYAAAADWFNSEISETTNRFIGVRFIDIENSIHYGWVRCDLINSGNTLIIKDYAYNATNDYGLYAGTEISINSSIAKDEWNIFTNNNILNIHYNGIDFEISKVSIYSSNGELMYNAELSMNFTPIDVSELEHGIYFVVVEDNSKRVTKELFLGF